MYEGLDVVFQCNELDREISLRDYLKELLCKVVVEGESFSGKRPFGNSGWQHDIAKALVIGKCIPGTYDEKDDEAYDFSWGDVETAITHLIVEEL